MADVVDFPGFKGSPADPDNWLVVPFEYHKVVIEGRAIPRLTAYREGDDKICLIVDDRFSQSVPIEIAHGVAWLIANAMAVAAGYPFLGAESKEVPFAPRCAEIKISDLPRK